MLKIKQYFSHQNTSHKKSILIYNEVFQLCKLTFLSIDFHKKYNKSDVAVMIFNVFKKIAYGMWESALNEGIGGKYFFLNLYKHKEEMTRTQSSHFTGLRHEVIVTVCLL